MIEESETPGIGSHADAAGDVLAERRARRAQEGDPAVMRRAEAAEAAVRNLETHLAALEQRLEEVGRERERIAQQLAQRESDVRNVKQSEFAEQQLRVEAEERGERLQREMRGEIEALSARLQETELHVRELDAELTRLRERDARLTPIVRELMEVAAGLRAGFERELAALREELQQQVIWERETYVRELTAMGDRMEDLRFELTRTADDLRAQLSVEPPDAALLRHTTEPESEREAAHRREMADALVAAVERLRARVADVKAIEAEEAAEPPAEEPPAAEEPPVEAVLPVEDAPCADAPAPPSPPAHEAPPAEESVAVEPEEAAEPPAAEPPVEEPPAAEEPPAEAVLPVEDAPPAPAPPSPPAHEAPPAEESVAVEPEEAAEPPAAEPPVEEPPAAEEPPAEAVLPVEDAPPAPAPAHEAPVGDLGKSGAVTTEAVASEPVALQARPLSGPKKRISWLAPAIRRLAAERDAKLAAELVIELLPAQADIVEGPVNYEIDIHGFGIFYVALDPGHATISREPAGAVDFSLEGPVAAFSELAAGGAPRRNKGLRVRKGRRGARRFLKLRRQPIALADVAAAGVDVWPGLLLLAMAEAIDPSWTAGRRFELAFEIQGASGMVIYVRVCDGEPLYVSRTPSAQPAATVALSGHALICLLAGAPAAAEHAALVTGDASAVDMFLQWTARAQGLSVASL